MNSPFGSSNQGGFRQQPQQQNFGQQGGFGVQTPGTFGGFQPQQQSFGFGGGQGFGGFGGGQGFGGFNPFQGGFGGFQPQQQFNPFQGGYGGGFQPQGFGGGFNPMFGGIGGLGFNPMMGPQFGMPMQQFGFGGFNPYQQQMLQNQQFMEQRDQALGPMQQAAQQARQQNPAYAQLQQLQGQFRDQNPSYEQLKQIHDLQNQIDSDPAFIKAKNAYESAAQQFQTQQRQPMYGGIGGLGFNPMMGPQFGMPMKQVQSPQYASLQQREVAEAEKARYAALTPEQKSDENNALRAQSQQEYSPIMGLQFGMPMGQQAQLPQQQAQLMQALQAAQMRAVMGI